LLRCNATKKVTAVTAAVAFFFYFFFLMRYSAAKKATTTTVVAFFSLFFFFFLLKCSELRWPSSFDFAALQLSKSNRRGDGSCRRLRLLVLLHCSAAEEGAFFL
jgi:hypothetical protein